MTKEYFEEQMKVWDLLSEDIQNLGGNFNSIQDDCVEDGVECVHVEFDNTVVDMDMDKIDDKVEELYKHKEKIAKRFRIKIDGAEALFDSCIVNRFEVYCDFLQANNIMIGEIREPHKVDKEDITKDSLVKTTIASSFGRENKRLEIETNIVNLMSHYVVLDKKENVYYGSDLDKAIEAYNKI